jgi:predicted ATPase/class 3 adenylate cyclase
LRVRVSNSQTMELFDAYLPMDRRQALARGEDLADRTHGAALFADISGFTPLTAALVEELGPQRGAEELILQLNQVYGALIEELHLYRGSVIGFSGDAITCWLDGDDGFLSTACALAMQRAMAQFAEVRTPAGTTVSLGVKVAVVTGPARRFLVGDPAIQRLEVLGGATLDRMAAAEKQADRGEVIVGTDVAERLGGQAAIQEWRTSSGGERLALVTALIDSADPSPWPAPSALPDEVARAWIFPPVYQRLREGQSAFLAELRPAAALFIKFWGLDYDGDEDAGAKLDAYVTWVQRVVTGYEGYLVDITVGDKGSYLYAAFGAPLAHEDDPARAVAAALGLRSPPSDLAFIAGVQMGISRGRMRAGALGGSGRRTYAVMGNEVNVAARLMGKAEPGQVKVSPRVAEAAVGQFAFEALGAIPLKGLPEPMPVFAAVGRKAQAAEGILKGRTLAPMVGRTAERAELAERLRALQEKGAGGVVVIAGEAGIGKSRLALDLLERAQEAGIATLLGAGQSIEQQTHYRAWRDVFAAYFGLGEVTGPAERGQHVRRAVEAAVPDHLQRLPLLNDVLNLGLPETELTSSLSPELRQQSLFLLLTDLLRAKAGERPLVLVLEDTHWLDSLSWDLAVYAARSLAISGEPLLLVAVTRPPEENAPAARHTAALQTMEEAETLSLAEMSPEETVALVANRLGVIRDDLPEPLAELVRQRAGGNPFFAEELVFALRDQGLLRVEEKDDHALCVLGEDFDRATAALPDDVQGLVLSRIDRLEPEQQLTLKVASVIGRTFPYRTLRYALGRHVSIDDATLRHHLETLEKLDLTPLETPEPELAYIFRHATTQEVAYGTLLFAQRRELHHTVAGWYEETFESEAALAPYFPLLVHHYHHAEDVGQERRYAGLAGHRAAAQYANDDAVRYLSRALELTPEKDLEERYDLFLSREKVLDLQGEREAQEQDVEALEALATTLDDDRRRVETALRRAYFAEITGKYPEAVVAARAAVSMARKAQIVAGQAKGLFRWGSTLWLQGQYESAQEKLDRARSLASIAQLLDVQADSLRNMGIVSFYLGDYARSVTCVEQALSIYRKVGDRIGESKSLDTLGNIFAEQGNYGEARSILQRALCVCREVGDRRGEGIALMNLGFISMEQGNYTEAKGCFGQSLIISQEIDDQQSLCWTFNNLGLLALLYQIDYAEAVKHFEQALHIARAIGDRQTEGSILSGLALVFHHLGDYEAVHKYSSQVVDIAREVGDRSTEGEALTHLGHALAGLGQLLEEATEAYWQGLTIRRGLGEENMAMETLAGLARVCLAQGDVVQAREHVDEVLCYLETGSLDGTYEPFRVYLTCYRVLEADGDARAGEVLATAYDLLQERAAKIEDEEMRRSFLENVDAHRELVAAWKKVGAIS